MQLLDAIATFLWANGVGQNLTASAILAIPATIWTRRKLLPIWRAHHQRVQEIHQALLPQHPNERPSPPPATPTTPGTDDAEPY